MAYFGFRLDELHCIYQRGKKMDSDIVTLAVTVNNEPRGAIVGRFNIESGARVPAPAVAPDIRGKFGLALGGWIVGPIVVETGDLVEVRYSGVNVSDTPPASDDEAAKIELPLLGALYGAAVGELAGPLGSALAGLAGGFTNIIEKALGYAPASCNGTVFVDIQQFSSDGLTRLPYNDNPGLECGVASFTNAYDDSATHDTSQCGHIAQTEVTYSVLKWDRLSTRYFRQFYWPHADLRKGLRQLVPGGAATSLRTLLCADPAAGPSQ